MVNELIKDSESRMKKAIDHLGSDFSGLRAGRANPGMLDRIMVNYYGQLTALNQLANITVADARLLIIQPWDKGCMSDIEKAIMKSDLGITPSNDGNVIRIAIPPLTEERRKELVKVVKKRAEECKVAIRNIRREANDQLKSLEKDKTISEDENKKGQDSIQKNTDKYIKDVDTILQGKEKEIMEV